MDSKLSSYSFVRKINHLSACDKFEIDYVGFKLSTPQHMVAQTYPKLHGPRD